MTTVLDISCVVVRKRHRENRETISIVKAQLTLWRPLGFGDFRKKNA